MFGEHVILHSFLIVANSTKPDPNFLDSYSGRYRACRRFDTTEGHWDPLPPQLLFLKKDIADLKTTFTQIQRGSTDESTVQEWKNQQLQTSGQFAVEVARIEEWEQSRQLVVPNNFPTNRYNFFIQKAAEIHPPLATLVLSKFPAFQRALFATDSDELAWASFLSLILPYRSQAESLTWGDPKWSPPETFVHLHFHRNNRRHYPPQFQPEQEVVLQLARNALEHCKKAATPDSLLVMACLQSVYKQYKSIQIKDLPSGLNFDGTKGPYILTLDDARMIVEEVLHPHVHHNSPRYSSIFKQFKCIGCQRKDWQKSFSFVDGFEHIHHQHAQRIEPGFRYHELFRYFPRAVDDEIFNFPWYIVPWPRCLPLVPHDFHLQQGTWWDPDAEYDFCSSRLPQKSIFDGRSLYSHPEIEADDFAGNFTFACSVLKPTNLRSLCQTKIALCYARDRHATAVENVVPLEDMILALHTGQKVNSKIELRFCCGVCVQDERVNRGSRFVKNAGEFHALIQHWHAQHPEAECNTVEMIDLPDDSDTMNEVIKTDEALRDLQLKARKRESKRLINPRMKVIPKAVVVMELRFGIDALDKLFPKVETI